MEPIHHRMPVILKPQGYSHWLAPAVHDVQPVASVLQPYPPDEMEAYPVSPFMNDPHHDNSLCVQRLDESMS